MLHCRDGERWGPGTVSLSGKGKAMEIRITRPVRSDEISGEMQEIEGVGHGRRRDWWLLLSFRLKHRMGLD